MLGMRAPVKQSATGGPGLRAISSFSQSCFDVGTLSASKAGKVLDTCPYQPFRLSLLHTSIVTYTQLKLLGHLDLLLLGQDGKGLFQREENGNDPIVGKLGLMLGTSIEPSRF
jgi:hypothetical protein